jgi:hypothetical protein
MMSRLAALVRLPQPAISSTVRRHPAQKPVHSSMTQTLMQGDTTSSLKVHSLRIGWRIAHAVVQGLQAWE